VLYNAATPSTALPGHTGTRRLAGVQPLADWWAGRPLAADGGWAALRSAASAAPPLLAAAGLAQPEGFFTMLEAQGLVIRRLPLADHHPLCPQPWPADTGVLVLTEKDAVKLPADAAGTVQVWVARLDFQPEPAFAETLRQLCAPFMPLKTPP